MILDLDIKPTGTKAYMIEQTTKDDRLSFVATEGFITGQCIEMFGTRLNYISYDVTHFGRYGSGSRVNVSESKLCFSENEVVDFVESKLKENGQSIDCGDCYKMIRSYDIYEGYFDEKAETVEPEGSIVE